MISIKSLCNFIEIAFRRGCSPVNLLHIFKTLFPGNTSGWLLLNIVSLCSKCRLWWFWRALYFLEIILFVSTNCLVLLIACLTLFSGSYLSDPQNTNTAQKIKFSIKVTLIQIISLNVRVHIKQYPENFAFLILGILE